MKKKYIIEVDESEIMEYWSELGVKEIGYQEYALKFCPNIKVKPYEERSQGEWKRHDMWKNGEYIGGFYHVNCPCEDGYYSKWETNFCPNCGQPMMKGGAE